MVGGIPRLSADYELSNVRNTTGLGAVVCKWGGQLLAQVLERQTL